jgi:hypothetical protein
MQKHFCFFRNTCRTLKNRAVFLFSWQNMKNIQIALFFLATNVEHSESHCFFFFAKYVEHSKLCSSVLCRGEKHAKEDKRKMRQTEFDGGGGGGR